MPSPGRGKKRGYQLHGWVEAPRYQFIFIELVRRLGVMEASRRIEITQRNLYNILNNRNKFIQVETIRRAILVLRVARANNEARHRDSIKHGAYLRGRQERVPHALTDFYVTTSDREAELRNKRFGGQEGIREYWRKKKQIERARRLTRSATT